MMNMILLGKWIFAAQANLKYKKPKHINPGNDKISKISSGLNDP